MTLLGSEHSLLIRSKFRSGRENLEISQNYFSLSQAVGTECFALNVGKQHVSKKLKGL